MSTPFISSRPLVGVGGIVFSADRQRVLLIKRGHEPAKGKWSVPGGLVEWGESLREACAREIAEETGLKVKLLGPVGILERRLVGAADEITHHYLIIDFWGYADGGEAIAGSDADAVEWAGVSECADSKREVTHALWPTIRRAQILAEGKDPPQSWLLE